jgi:hypothetical protein
MLEVEEAVYALLSGSGTIIALVPGTGTNAAGVNVFPDEAPKGIGHNPYLVYKKISDPTLAWLQGSSGLAESRFQFDAVAPTKAAAKAIKNAVYDLLEGYVGTQASILIECCLHEGEHAYVTPSVDDDNLRTFGYSQDWMIWHQQT